jgi:hypothetical protein
LRVSGGFHPLAQGLFAVFVVMLVSCAYFVLVERPCMQKDWPQRAWARLTGRPTGSI